MSRTEGAALTVLELVADAVAAIDAGEAPEAVITRRLAVALEAEAAVLAPLTAGMPGPVAFAWPDHRRGAALLARLRAGPAETLLATTSVFSGRIGGTTHDEDGDHDEQADRVFVLAFSRRRPFDEDDLRVWECAQRPISVLWAHVERQRRAGRTPYLAAAPIAPPDEIAMTPRERQVLGLLAEGLMATAIARSLHLSPRTVHKHLGSIYRKLGVRDRLLAVTVAHQHGLIPDMPRAEQPRAI